jgi:hypothetical protein
MHCLNCGKDLVNTPGKKVKQFCGISCRSNYWQKKKRNENGLSAKKPGRPKKATSEIQNTDLILPGGLGDVKFPNGKTGEIVQSVSNRQKGSVTLTIAPYPPDEAGKYATGVDPYSKGLNKGKSVIFKKKKDEPRKFVLTEKGPIGVPELPHERKNNFKEIWEQKIEPVTRSFRDYMDLLKTGEFDRKTLQKEVQDDKKLLPAQKSMIYAKLT